MKYWLTEGKSGSCPNCGATIDNARKVWCQPGCRDSITLLCQEYGYPAHSSRSWILAAWLDFPKPTSCSDCGFTGPWNSFELDHILALVNGGKDHLSNWQFLCRSCHKDKTRKDLGLMARRRRIGLAQTTIYGENALNMIMGSPA